MMNLVEIFQEEELEHGDDEDGSVVPDPNQNEAVVEGEVASR
jgi:hypothetical protein